MNRRAAISGLATALAMAPLTGISGSGAGVSSPVRPDAAADPDGPGRWRIRSWEWRAGAWRPVIAHATVTPLGIVLNGRIAADRAEIDALLAGLATP